MVKEQFPILAITTLLENETYLAQALFFPELIHYGSDVLRVEEAVKLRAGQLIEELPLVELYRRRLAMSPELNEVKIALAPRSSIWREPATLKFHMLRWQHGDDTEIVFIPALGIEVVSKDVAELATLVLNQIRAELMRRKITESLRDLVFLQRGQSLQLSPLTAIAEIRSPKQIAIDLDKEERKKSVLAEVGSDLTTEKLPEAFEIDETVAKLAEALSGRNPKSILLIGPSGAGKTAAVYQLVRRRHAFQLGHTPFWATTGARLVAGMSGYGMWQERCQELWREAAKLKAVLYFGNLLELMEVGKSISSSQGIAAFFRPYLMRGDILAITECLPEQLPIIEREDPHLLEAFHQIRIDEPSREKGHEILLSYLMSYGSRTENLRRKISANPKERQSPDHGQLIDLDIIETIDRLHRRYATYSAYPGRPLRFLKNSLQRAEESNSVLTETDIIENFSRETGLPRFLLNDEVRLDLIETRAWFAERVIGQPLAVELITALLAMVKAGLTRPQRPIASLLFIGPTGVGKTELAKSLAEFLFQDRNRLARFDMSEYSDPYAVKRLIGGITTSEGLLTAKVREQPFSVILFDEFEKADPLFFDLLLQVLGEGRLTDAGGRVADFRNCVVIMTSNLGAESFQRGTMGFFNELNGDEITRHFVNEVRAFLRPEMFNRIDRIVPFAPLAEDAILQIAKRELTKLQERDGIRYRQVRLNISEPVARHLANRGFHPRYGARPLKRAIERELLVPLSEGLNNYAADLLLTADVEVEQEQLRVNIKAHPDAAKAAAAADAALIELVYQCAEIRRDTHKLAGSSAFQEVDNEIFRAERLAKRISGRTYKRPEDLARIGRLPVLKQLVAEVKTLSERICAIEDETRLAFYGKTNIDKITFADELKRLNYNWQSALLSLYALDFKRADYVTLAVYCENQPMLYEFANAYFNIAAGSDAQVEMRKLIVVQPEKEKDRTGKKEKTANQKRADKNSAATENADDNADLEDAEKEKEKEKKEKELLKWEVVTKPLDFLKAARENTPGIALGINGKLALPKYQPERGLHIVKLKDQDFKCFIHTSEAPLANYLPPPGIHRRGAIGNQDRRRSYNHDEYYAEDFILKKRFTLGRKIDDVVASAMDELILQAARNLID